MCGQLILRTPPPSFLNQVCIFSLSRIFEIDWKILHTWGVSSIFVSSKYIYLDIIDNEWQKCKLNVLSMENERAPS